MNFIKTIKGLAITFVLSLILSCTGVKAATIWSLIELDIPAAQGIFTLNSPQPHQSGYQYLRTISTVDKLTGEARAVLGRTKHIITPVSYSDWKQAVNGGSAINWENQNSEFGYYDLQLKAKTWTITGFWFFGEWTV
ncbi:MAG: hypothetical protein PHO63_01320 [Bacilli bacterium]|nr:hypothetical protein [Bacilli bacterium]MDD4809315.1 hypothetical protein [Bacilli bacterium]